jgi:hypothetical protein
LPAAPAMPMQRQLSTRRTAGNAAIRASSRPHLVGRWVLLHPALDVQLTSYDSSGVPYSIFQWLNAEHDSGRVPARLGSPSSLLRDRVGAYRQRSVPSQRYLKSGVTPKSSWMMANAIPAKLLPGNQPDRNPLRIPQPP